MRERFLCAVFGSRVRFLLSGEKDHESQSVLYVSYCSDFRWKKCWVLTFLGTWQNPGFPTLFYTKTKEKVHIFQSNLAFHSCDMNELIRVKAAEAEFIRQNLHENRPVIRFKIILKFEDNND